MIDVREWGESNAPNNKRAAAEGVVGEGAPAHADGGGEMAKGRRGNLRYGASSRSDLDSGKLGRFKFEVRWGFVAKDGGMANRQALL